MAHLNLSTLIEKKRNGEVLSEEEIFYFVKAVGKSAGCNGDTHGESADRCQIGAMLMAFYLKGLNNEETLQLTQSMTHSGHVFSWPLEWRHLVVDKHSTGGVGDKVSLILVPVLAAVGLKVPMISGRTLAHTGGTLDKLESISGFRTNLTVNEIMKQMDSIGCCITGQTANCVPADKILYQCRDMTATVTCASLIIASIVSKKLAEGVSNLVYDVKFGKGSIFSTEEEALETAKRLVAASSNVTATALLTAMDFPLGKTIGNSLEVLESLDCLKGRGPSDVLQIVEALGCELISKSLEVSRKEACLQIADVLKSGKALKMFFDILTHQGVAHETATELCYKNSSNVLPRAKYVSELVYSGERGYISGIDPLVLGKAWKDEVYLSSNHPGVGFTLFKQIGEAINEGDVWMKFHHESKSEISHLQTALTVSKARITRRLIEKRIHSIRNAVTVEHYS